MKSKLHILDSMFSHADSSCHGLKPEQFDWVREPNPNVTFFSDSHVTQVDKHTSEKKIAWLLESPCLTYSSYKYVENNYNKFYKIFTFDKKLLDKCKNSELLPIGGCWILSDDRQIHKKTKQTSFITSQKNFLPGHKLRHLVIQEIKNIDVFGRGYRDIENKIEGLKDYQFSIVIENCKSDYYFTEKLIDCFVTGTIPIYWGCPSIGNFFENEGIITFNDLNDLKVILNSLGGEYEKRKKYVETNFKIATNFILADDNIYKKIKNII